MRRETPRRRDLLAGTASTGVALESVWNAVKLRRLDRAVLVNLKTDKQ